MRLLVTRPASDGERTAETLRARGHQVLLAPLLRVEPVPADLPAETFEAVVMTSANAARALADQPARVRVLAHPVFAVGRRTAEAAWAAGFSQVRSSDGDQSDLARAIVEGGLRGPLIYLAGEDRAGDLVGDLAGYGIRLHTLVVYRAAVVERFPGDLETALREGGLEGVLHFSRRTADAYMAGAAAAGLLTAALVPVHYCLSRQVAAALPVGARIEVSSRPEEAALLSLIDPPG